MLGHLSGRRVKDIAKPIGCNVIWLAVDPVGDDRQTVRVRISHRPILASRRPTGAPGPDIPREVHQGRYTKVRSAWRRRGTAGMLDRCETSL